MIKVVNMCHNYMYKLLWHVNFIVVKAEVFHTVTILYGSSNNFRFLALSMVTKPIKFTFYNNFTMYTYPTDQYSTLGTVYTQELNVRKICSGIYKNDQTLI